MDRRTGGGEVLRGKQAEAQLWATVRAPVCAPEWAQAWVWAQSQASVWAVARAAVPTYLPRNGAHGHTQLPQLWCVGGQQHKESMSRVAWGAWCVCGGVVFVCGGVVFVGDGVQVFKQTHTSHTSLTVHLQSPQPPRPPLPPHLHILLTVLHVSTGYFPRSVSAPNRMPSTPSSTAFATSVASARVGRGEVT